MPHEFGDWVFCRHASGFQKGNWRVASCRVPALQIGIAICNRMKRRGRYASTLLEIQTDRQTNGVLPKNIL
jgi:hypothetical protein